MSNRTANYAAFYVAEPFNESNLGANATPDFLYYNQLRAWKGADNTFPFVDAHAKTYNVRDGSEWETLKKRLHERLDASKNNIWCSTGMRKQVKDLWGKLPEFRDNMDKVATLHVPYKKALITSALKDADFMVQTMTTADAYHYRLDK